MTENMALRDVWTQELEEAIERLYPPGDPLDQEALERAQAQLTELIEGAFRNNIVRADADADEIKKLVGLATFDGKLPFNTISTIIRNAEWWNDAGPAFTYVCRPLPPARRDDGAIPGLPSICTWSMSLAHGQSSNDPSAVSPLAFVAACYTVADLLYSGCVLLYSSGLSMGGLLQRETGSHPIISHFVPRPARLEHFPASGCPRPRSGTVITHSSASHTLRLIPNRNSVCSVSSCGVGLSSLLDHASPTTEKGST